MRTASVQRLVRQVRRRHRPSARASERWPRAVRADLAAPGSRAERRARHAILRKLRWAAQLHEIGSHISHSDYHKHGAYILDNADATGFALAELHRLSLLVLGHRGKLRKLEADLSDVVLVQQLLALRLAIILCHARREPDMTGLMPGAHRHGQPLGAVAAAPAGPSLSAVGPPAARGGHGLAKDALVADVGRSLRP